MHTVRWNGLLGEDVSAISRRRLLQLGAAAGASVLLPAQLVSRPAAAALPGGTLDPTAIGKYGAPLVIPPAMPRTSTLQRNAIDHYVIGVRQFR